MVGGFATSRAFGMPDQAIIATNCTAAQTVLNQIQKADTGSRINRGHSYNELLDLMFAMNARLAVNKIAAPTLTNLASQFEQNLAKFRTDYDAYDNALSNVLNLKCTNDPIGFYSQLETARAARVLLNQDVATLNQNLNDYYTEFDLIIKEAGRS